jgi:acid stress chaperone HdeB
MSRPHAGRATFLCGRLVGLGLGLAQCSEVFGQRRRHVVRPALQGGGPALFVREKAMIKFILVALGLLLALEKVPLAQAQVTLDVSKITCEQYNAYKITNPQNIAIWVNGYYHGKRGDVTLDTQGLVENARKLRDYCRRHRQTLVMQAVETLFAKDR